MTWTKKGSTHIFTPRTQEDVIRLAREVNKAPKSTDKFWRDYIPGRVGTDPFKIQEFLLTSGKNHTIQDWIKKERGMEET